MTEPTPEPTEDSALDSDATDQFADDAPVTNMGHVRKIRAEARRLRTLLREEQSNRQSEAEKFATDREGDLAKLAEYERAEIERQASTVLVDPQDLFRHTSEQEQQAWYDERFGTVVGDRVKEAAAAIAAQRPHLAKPNVTPPPSRQPLEGLRSGAAPAPEKQPASWHGALRGMGI